MFERKSDPSTAPKRPFPSLDSKKNDPPAGGQIDILRQENLMLSQRVQELEKQVQNLTITNEFLLDQNAQLRMGVKATTTAVAAPPGSAVVPAVPAAVPAVVPAVVSMSVAAANMPQPPPVMSMAADQPIRISGAAVGIPPQNATITMATLDQPQNATITMSTLDAPPPAVPAPTASLPMQQPMPSSAAVMSCCHGPEMTPAGHVQQTAAGNTVHVQQTAAGNTVHVQETRLVTFPITSMRQPM